MDGVQEQEIYFLLTVGISIIMVLAVGFVIFYLFSQRKMFLQKVKSQELLIQYTILAQEEERSRIAKDMHDEIGSKLNVISLYTQQLKNKSSNKEQMKESVDFITQNIKDAIDTTRRIAHDLLPPTLEEFGLLEALQELCDAFSKSGKLNIQLSTEGDQSRIPDKVVELNLFRILQELINNSIKHGKSDEIKIHCKMNGDKSSISYKDNGRGFDSSKKRESKGLGMNSIDSRIKIIKGRWNYSSTIGNGMEAEIFLNKNT